MDGYPGKLYDASLRRPSKPEGQSPEIDPTMREKPIRDGSPIKNSTKQKRGYLWKKYEGDGQREDELLLFIEL